MTDTAILCSRSALATIDTVSAEANMPTAVRFFDEGRNRSDVYLS